MGCVFADQQGCRVEAAARDTPGVLTAQGSQALLPRRQQPGGMERHAIGIHGKRFVKWGQLLDRAVDEASEPIFTIEEDDVGFL